MTYAVKKILVFAVTITVIIGLLSAQVYGLGTGDAMLINKSHPLQPLDYTPAALTVPAVALAEPSASQEMLLDRVAAKNLASLFRAARSDNVNLVLTSGYRPYEDQVAIYSFAVGKDRVATDESIARPGFSEHQSGLAADISLSNYFCVAQGCFGLSRASAWLEQNAYKYGFTVRYPLYKMTSTGYEYEPWHLRYVGQALAAQLHQRRETLEEFYGLP
jgi:D-alanyl-D-alanine carboxypeptidase